MITPETLLVQKVVHEELWRPSNGNGAESKIGEETDRGRTVVVQAVH
jgi:hypothetical protein